MAPTTRSPEETVGALSAHTLRDLTRDLAAAINLTTSTSSTPTGMMLRRVPSTHVHGDGPNAEWALSYVADRLSSRESFFQKNATDA